MDLFLIFIISFLLSLLLHPVAIWVSNNYNIFDNPYRDHIHEKPTPVLGGTAICLSIIIAIIVARAAGFFEWDRVADGLLVGGGLIALVGFIDDRFGMNPTIKLTGQIISGGMFVIFTQASIGIFHPFVEFGALIFGLVVMMNAFNILDNMDGITGSMSFAAGLSFFAVAILSKDHNMAILAAALVGALIGFLKYNLPKAKIFMGDSGAMFLGFILGAFAIMYMMHNKSYYLMTTPFLILSYPIFDIALVSLSRIREKRSLAVAAPDSSPYRFTRWVFSTNNAFVGVFVINLIMGIFGVATYMLKENQLSVLLIFISGLSLSVLGVHLYRNFLFFLERTMFIIIDMLSINIAFYFLYSLKYSWCVFPYEVFIPYSEMFAPAVWISLFWVLLFSVMGIYEIRPDRRFFDYMLSLFKVIGLGVAVFVAAIVFLEGDVVISIWPVLLYVSVLLVVNCIFRYISFLIIRWLFNRPDKKPRVAIYIKDINSELNELLDLVKQRFQVIGYFCSENSGEKYDSLMYLGDENKLNEIIRSQRLEKIILVWPDDNYDDFTPILSSYFYLEYQFLLMGEPSAPFDGFKTIKLYRPGFIRLSMELLRTWEWGVKRALDISFSLLTLAITSPLFVLEYLIAKMKKHPFLVKAAVYGRDGQPGYCYDFYSHASKYSRRDIIRPGLPALISVIKGSLTLVGTLPLSPEKAAKDSEIIPGFWRRELIKPGIFGLAHFSDQEKYLEKEMKYIGKMSILLDVCLIITGILHKLKILPGKKGNAGSEVY